MSHLHLKVKCFDRSVCTGSTNSKSKKTWWEWRKLQYTKCTTYCKYMRFSGLFVALQACLGWNENIHNDSQLVKVGFIHIQEAYSGQETPGRESGFEPIIPEPCLSFRLSGMHIRGVPELQWYASKSCGFATNKWAYVSYFDPST